MSQATVTEQVPADETSHSWGVGVALNLAGSISINVGTILVKTAHLLKEQHRPEFDRGMARRKLRKGELVDVDDMEQSELEDLDIEEEDEALIRRYKLRFIGGWLLFTVGNFLNFASFSQAAQSLLSALGSVQFVSNTIFAKLLLDTPITAMAAVGTLVIVVGNTGVVLTASKTNKKWSSGALMRRWVEPDYLGYLLAMAALCVLLHTLYLKGMRRYWFQATRRLCIRKEWPVLSSLALYLSRCDGMPLEVPRNEPPSQQEEILVFTDDSDEARNAIASRHSSIDSGDMDDSDGKCIQRIEALPPTSRVLASLFAFISACFGTQSVLTAKSCAELLARTMAGNSQMKHPYTYLVLLGWAGLMVFWLSRMNYALKKWDGVFIIPAMQVGWIVFSIVSGGIYFEEFQTMNGTQVVFFVMSIFAILSGVVLIARQPPQQVSREQAAIEISSALAAAESIDGVTDGVTGGITGDGVIVPGSEPDRIGTPSEISVENERGEINIDILNTSSHTQPLSPIYSVSDEERSDSELLRDTSGLTRPDSEADLPTLSRDMLHRTTLTATQSVTESPALLAMRSLSVFSSPMTALSLAYESSHGTTRSSSNSQRAQIHSSRRSDSGKRPFFSVDAATRRQFRSALAPGPRRRSESSQGSNDNSPHVFLEMGPSPVPERPDDASDAGSSNSLSSSSSGDRGRANSC
ncbi:MAG: hypothetical protein MHM6MM_006741 [Cercozoa sp. M6MM]